MRMRTNNNNKEGAMTKIIQIEGSPRKDRSHSSKIANEYLKKISEKQDVSVKTIDIWTKDLPEFNGEMMNAKYAVIGGVDPTQEQKAAWEKVTNIFDEFSDGQHYVISAPMWNFNIPYKLKHYIDIITQPGLSWSYTPEDGYKGLMSGRTATVVYASGDGYGEGTGFEAFDLQKPYLNLWLTFIGFDKVNQVIVDRTLFGPEEAEKKALEDAMNLADSIKI
ncbi:MAG: FMN-dependent NADH-azoreductase [Gammaproteobacteria bacterium]|nr:FMN-dependent NADH-azoreductase [Gammaproteobacteria bacterium]